MHPVVKTVWEAVPKPIQDVIAMTTDRLLGHPLPVQPHTARETPVRLFITPANYAGQGHRWARAVEVNPRVSAANTVYVEINPFAYPVDFPVRWRSVTHSWRWQRNELKALTNAFTHVLVEAEFPPLGGMFRQDVRRQVRALIAGGSRVAMVCHGSDIRLPSRHAILEPWSPFVDDEWVPVASLEKAVQNNRDLLDDLGLPTFVSTAGLLLDVPYAHLLPVVIDAELWSSDEPVLERDVPRVLHVPSNPLVKGTAQIEPALRRLHDEGLIEYVQVHGVTHTEMPDVYRGGDIVLDQFRLGDYGVAACEAMAAGRLVISHVSDQVRNVVKAFSGVRLPIVEGHLDSIEGVLRDVLSNRETYRAIAAMGPAFVHRVHSGELSRSVLEKHFLETDGPPAATL